RRPEYSAIRTNDGELIVAVTPRPVPKPLANCVLAAPRPPTRLSRSPGSATAARAAPSARVVSGSGLIAERSRAVAGIGARVLGFARSARSAPRGPEPSHAVPRRRLGAR